MINHLLASESIVGVDIGSKSIKVVRAEPTKQGDRITHVAMCPTPPDSVKEGVVVNPQEVASALKFALRSMGIKSSGAVAAIAGPGVMIRQVQLPSMPEKVLRKSIRFEAGKYVSAPMEDCVVEFEITGPSREEGQMDVTLVVAPKVMVDSRVDVLEQAGLEPVCVDVEVFAIIRSLTQLGRGEFATDGGFALVDIGASHAEINLISKGILALTRTIPIAGDSLTSAIISTDNHTDEEAEQIKYSMDMSELVSAPPGTAGSPGLRVVQSLVDELLREIRRSINYYQSQLQEGASDTSIDRIILTGGTSRLKGLGAYTKSRLNLDVHTVDTVITESVCLPSTDGVGEEDIPILMVALGLSARKGSAMPAARVA